MRVARHGGSGSSSGTVYMIHLTESAYAQLEGVRCMDGFMIECDDDGVMMPRQASDKAVH